MIRAVGTSLGILILTIFLLLSIFTYCLVKFTEFDNLNSIFSKILVSKIVSEDKINQTYNNLLSACENKESTELSLGNKTISLKCDDIRNSSPENVLAIIGKPLLYDVYYKKYDCNFIECLNEPGEEKFLILISQKANDFFKFLQCIFLTLAGIGLALILISVKDPENKLKTLGITLLSIGIPILILIFIKDYFISLPTELESLGEVIFDISFISFLIVTLIGLILTIVGCVLKLKPAKTRKK
jgi:hypothetical protein